MELDNMELKEITANGNENQHTSEKHSKSKIEYIKSDETEQMIHTERVIHLLKLLEVGWFEKFLEVYEKKTPFGMSINGRLSYASNDRLKYCFYSEYARRIASVESLEFLLKNNIIDTSGVIEILSMSFSSSVHTGMSLISGIATRRERR